MITCDFSIVPIGSEDTDCGDYVSVAVDVIKDSGLSYELTGMGTHIEADNYDELYSVLRDAQEAVFSKGVGRVYSVIKIDDRRDLSNRGLEDKIISVENRLK